MNATIAVVLLPLSVWLYPISVPPNVTAVVAAHLPPICNATSTLTIKGPATATIACVNPGLEPVRLSGWVSVNYMAPPPPPPPERSLEPLVVVAAATAAAAGVSHLVANRRELLLAPFAPIAARVKKARADDPIRREIVGVVERMGAATMSQIAKSLGKSWGAVQWHIYVLEREGRLRSVKIGPFVYYYVNPKAAADVILSSVDPSVLSPDDREKLEFMAS